MDVGFQSNAFQNDAFATDAYVYLKPDFTAKQPRALIAVLESWLEYGAATLRKFAEQDPAAYVRLVVEQLPPKDAKLCQCEGMCEEDFNALSSMIVEALRADRGPCRPRPAANSVVYRSKVDRE